VTASKRRCHTISANFTIFARMASLFTISQITQDLDRQWHDCAAPFRPENHRDLRRIASRHAACVVGSNDRFHRAITTRSAARRSKSPTNAHASRSPTSAEHTRSGFLGTAGSRRRISTAQSSAILSHDCPGSQIRWNLVRETREHEVGDAEWRECPV
jgi:hypothetical protein